ncbi:hypothetical protein [Paenibacillus sp. GCM10012306]|uniref:hypothetical protein n=1 Tax=Paenibacillus sp. GCM10012306 TaxID=3317342 RepID=UPI003614B4D7
MSWIYIVAVIIFAIVSNVNKANKTKGKGAPPGGMPTFGGGDDSPLRRVKRDVGQQGRTFPPPGAPVPRETRELAREERELEESFPMEREQQWIPGSDADTDTGNEMTVEQGEELDSVNARTEKMQQELERLHAVFDEMSGEPAPSVKHASEPVNAGMASRPVLATSREDLRKGLIWAEILGPPRSKRPHAYRKEN